MRLQQAITLLVLAGGLSICQTSWGQFPGRLLDRIGDQAQQELRNQLQQALPQLGGGWERVRPVDPPPRIIEPPFLPPPPPTTCPTPRPQPPVYPAPYPPVTPLPTYPPAPPLNPQPPTPSPAGSVPQPPAIVSNAKPGTIQPIQPVGDHPAIETGQTVSITGQQYGTQPGTVTINLGNQLELKAEVVSWQPGNIRARMPQVPLSAAAPATVRVHDANRNLVDELQVSLIPGTSTAAENATRIQPDSPPAEKPTETPALATSLKVAQPATAVEVGKVISLSGQAFGGSLGRVRMVVGSMAFDTQVTDWQSDRVTVQLPAIDLTAPVDGQLLVYRGDGSLVNDLAVQFTAPKSIDALVQIDQ